MCSNFYGSNEVVDANTADGNRLRKEQLEKYNYTMDSDIDECRKSN